MRYATTRSWAFYPAATLAALLGLGWCAPMRALGSCGDYVTMSSHASSSTPHSIPYLRSGDFGTARHNAPPFETTAMGGDDVALPAPVPCGQCPERTGSPGRVPCQGPWCSGSNDPMTPPTSVVERPLDPWGLCCSAAILKRADSFSHTFLRGDSDRIHHVSPIYRPPRSA
jgi:hypothetical protein